MLCAPGGTGELSGWRNGPPVYQKGIIATLFLQINEKVSLAISCSHVGQLIGRIVLPHGALYRLMSHFWLWAKIQLPIEIAKIS